MSENFAASPVGLGVSINKIQQLETNHNTLNLSPSLKIGLEVSYVLMWCVAGICTSCRVSGTTWCGSVGRTHGSECRTPERRRGKIIVQVRNIITHKIIYGTNGEFTRCRNWRCVTTSWKLIDVLQSRETERRSVCWDLRVLVNIEYNSKVQSYKNYYEIFLF